MYYGVIITQNMQILSVKLYLFSNINANSNAVFTSSFFFLNIKCLESASPKDNTDVISFQLHVDMDTKYIINSFLFLEIMIIESICLKVKDLDLYIIETACKFIKASLIYCVIKQ